MAALASSASLSSCISCRTSSPSPAVAAAACPSRCSLHVPPPSPTPSPCTSLRVSPSPRTANADPRRKPSRPCATTSDDEWGEDPAPYGRPEPLDDSVQAYAASISTAVKEPKEEDDGSDIADLKRALVDSLIDTDRGLKASSEVRADIVELITQLEAKNPTPAPMEALPLLNGKWILAYTSFSELFPLLAAGTLPLVKVGEISQFIDSNALTVENSVTFTGPLATTSFSASASFEVRSPKRVQIKFEEGVIGTPQLTDSIEMPENVEFMGQKIDLTPAQGVLRSLQEAASSVARRFSGTPPLKFPIRTNKAQSWLLTTYLDSDVRISRGDGGSIFVLLKAGSPLLADLSY